MEPSRELLEIAVSKAEAVASAVVAEVRFQTDRTARLLGLGGAALGGIIAVVGLVRAAEIPIGPIAFLAFAAGVAILVGGLLQLLWAYVGGRRGPPIALGPGIAALRGALTVGGMSPRGLLASHLLSLEEGVAENAVRLSQVGRHQARALFAMFGSTVLFLLTLAFIVGRPILG